jgi:hypothetical protein
MLLTSLSATFLAGSKRFVTQEVVDPVGQLDRCGQDARGQRRCQDRIDRIAKGRPTGNTKNLIKDDTRHGLLVHSRKLGSISFLHFLAPR